LKAEAAHYADSPAQLGKAVKIRLSRPIYKPDSRSGRQFTAAIAGKSSQTRLLQAVFAICAAAYKLRQ